MSLMSGVKAVLAMSKSEVPRATRDFRRRAWLRFQAALDRHLAKPR
jgi:hypothetical protein